MRSLTRPFEGRLQPRGVRAPGSICFGLKPRRSRGAQTTASFSNLSTISRYVMIKWVTVAGRALNDANTPWTATLCDIRVTSAGANRDCHSYASPPELFHIMTGHQFDHLQQAESFEENRMKRPQAQSVRGPAPYEEKSPVAGSAASTSVFSSRTCVPILAGRNGSDCNPRHPLPQCKLSAHSAMDNAAAPRHRSADPAPSTWERPTGLFVGCRAT